MCERVCVYTSVYTRASARVFSVMYACANDYVSLIVCKHEHKHACMSASGCDVHFGLHAFVNMCAYVLVTVKERVLVCV